MVQAIGARYGGGWETLPPASVYRPNVRKGSDKSRTIDVTGTTGIGAELSLLKAAICGKEAPKLGPRLGKDLEHPSKLF